jgi:hypothetical protein
MAGPTQRPEPQKLNNAIRPAPFRTNLLMQAGINPMSPVQIQVIEAAFRVTNYAMKYLPR